MTENSPSSESLRRREFLRLSAAGVAGCIGSIWSGAARAIPPQQGQGAESPPDVPDPAGVVDENWQEPWTWRPEEWPGRALELNVVRNQSPGPSPSPGNPTGVIFSFNGTSPGPTIRMRGDASVRIRLRNTLPLSELDTQVGASPDPVELPPTIDQAICAKVQRERPGEFDDLGDCLLFDYPEQLIDALGIRTVPGWALKGHVNGQHGFHVTNLHTHGLHVAPGTNADGTHSDNVLLRLLPQADWAARRASDDPDLHALAPNEHVGELEYDIRLPLARDGRTTPHPPGTHWYHPHPHGATHDQVASGMAGFLIVEGDVDDAINEAMTGVKRPEPDVPTGPFDYRERLILLQRVFVQPSDQGAGLRRDKLRFPPAGTVNGTREASVMTMRPGAVERWRVLNGSVDGSGTQRFMVLEGQFYQQRGRMHRVINDSDEPTRRRLAPVTQQDFEDAKLSLQQLSFDGITLVEQIDGQARHVIRDLGERNAGTQNPFALPGEPADNEFAAQLRAYEACFRDGDSLRRAYVRPNEVYLGNANRADVFFRAPLDSAGKVFTVFAQEAHLHTDNFQQQLQSQIARPELGPPNRGTFDVVVAYIHVRGAPVDGGDFDIQTLNGHLPPVPDLFRPVAERELRVGAEEAAAVGVPTGSARTRVLAYSGTGGADYPSIRMPEGFAERHPELEGLVWARHDDVAVLLPNLTRTMAVNARFDLAGGADPPAPLKFALDDPTAPRVLVGTAEEWVVYNSSMMLWAHTDRDRFPQPGSYYAHYESFPLERHEGQRRFWQDPEFRISSKGSDHPFHIHINPMWVLRIDVPDENGELHNILPAPQWMDTVPIPRNGGRVVFRTRFDDYVGTWVHHCHILLHEDMGMMQTVECGDDPRRADYRPRQQVASATAPAAAVDRVYPRPTVRQMYEQNFSFEEPNELGRQEYPGFELPIPTLDDEDLATDPRKTATAS